MKNKLKQFRANAGLTQAALAKKIGVTQPNYQRWESGAVAIPQDKLNKLAKVLGASVESLLGRHAPVEARFYDNSAGDHLNYFGEVAIHFLGGGEPLLLSISEGARSDLMRALQSDAEFVSVKSLANQTVAIRVRAVSDVYFSSEAYDTLGPEPNAYVDSLEIQMPDPRDWEIVEALHDEIGLDDFDPADVERVRRKIMISDEQYAELLADGSIKAEDVEREKAKNQAITDRIFRAASTTSYQLSTGVRRDVYFRSSKEIYRAFSDLVECIESAPIDVMIVVQSEGYDRAIFINKYALDYVSIPTHHYEEGEVDAMAAELEGMD